MSYVCQNCGKVPVHGHSQRHRRGVAGKRWEKRAQVTPKLFKPNLQRVSVIMAGKKVSLRLCATCIKKFKKEGKIAIYSSSSALG